MLINSVNKPYFAFKMAQNYVKNHKTILFLHISKILDNRV